MFLKSLWFTAVLAVFGSMVCSGIDPDFDPQVVLPVMLGASLALSVNTLLRNIDKLD